MSGTKNMPFSQHRQRTTKPSAPERASIAQKRSLRYRKHVKITLPKPPGDKP